MGIHNEYHKNCNLINFTFFLNNQLIQYPLIDLNKNSTKTWLTWIPNTRELNEGITILIDNLQGYCSTYNKSGQFLGNFELNETAFLFSNYTLVDIINSDGLQIKTDPGIPVIYLGFFLLMLTTIISYKSYSQIWILKNNSEIFIGGNTTRATFEFEFEFFKLLK